MVGMPEGWYDDPAPANPAAPTTMRWWDGQGWTTRVRAATRRERAERREQVALRQMAMAGAPGDQRSRTALPAPDPRDHTPDGQALAGWWSRVAASLVDSLITSVVTVVLALPWLRRLMAAYRQYVDLALEAARTHGAPPSAEALQEAVIGWLLAVVAVSLLVRLVYGVVFLKAFGATPGKLVLGLEVRRPDHPGVLGWGPVLLRGVAVLVLGWVPFGSLLDVLWPLWDGRRQALHDKVAGTVVVRR